MFPGGGAEVFYNEAGEPLGWDNPSYDPDDYAQGYDGDDWLAVRSQYDDSYDPVDDDYLIEED